MAPVLTYRASRPAIPMPGSRREDAMIVSVLRDGTVYFGNERVDTTWLPSKICARLKDRDVERKVYIRADARSRYRTVKQVLNGIRTAGIERVAFLVEICSSPTTAS